MNSEWQLPYRQTRGNDYSYIDRQMEKMLIVKQTSGDNYFSHTDRQKN